MSGNVIQRRALLASITASTLAASFYPAGAQIEVMRGDRMPYDAFERLAKINIEIAGSVIHVAFASAAVDLEQQAVLNWIRHSAEAVSIYYGRFPIAELKLLIVPVAGTRVRGGTTWGYRGAAIRVLLGSEAREEDLRRDWVMVHEMVHLALPDMPERYSWLSEGLAVYVEPIARVQAGQMNAQEIWAAMVRDMPKGLPATGDRGLDNTDTWGRKYWGGATFCLLADVEIRKSTENRVGLQDAMRGVITAGGNHEKHWPIERILSTAGKSVGNDALVRLHQEMGSKPVATNLSQLWRDLGLRLHGDILEFDDGAPLANVRKAITAKRA